MYVVIKTTQTRDIDNYPEDHEELMFGGKDVEVLTAAADLMTGMEVATYDRKVTYDVQELPMLERKDLLRLGEFLKEAEVSLE